MKVPPAKADQFATSPPAQIKSILIYGPDSGLISIRSNLLAKSFLTDDNDPFSSMDFSYKTIKKNPSSFTDELYANTLTGGRRVLKIFDCENSLLKPLQEVISDNSYDHMTIWHAGELSPSSSLRKCFEAHTHLAALACYKDDIASLKSVIMSRLKEHGFNATTEAIDMLSHSFSGNRLIVLNEIDKLILYKGADRTITGDDVTASTGHLNEVSLDLLCQATASKNGAAMMSHIHKAYADNVGAITIIRTLLYYFMRLHLVQSRIGSGISEQQAINSLKPPIFFKNIASFKTHLKYWNSKQLYLVIDHLTKLEKQCKQAHIPAELLIEHFLAILPLAIQSKTNA